MTPSPFTSPLTVSAAAMTVSAIIAETMHKARIPVTTFLIS